MHRIVVALAGSLAFASLNPAQAASKPVVAFTDDAGDAGLNGQSAPVAGQGVDLVGGTYHRDGADLVMTVTAAEMPAEGATREVVRLLWHFNVNKVEYRLTVKSFDIGKPDVIARTGTERIGRIDQNGHFRLEQCAADPSLVVITLNNCVVVSYLTGAFAPDKKTITIKVPLKDIKATTGSTVTAGTGGASSTNCEICWVFHYAERSLTPSTVIDSAVTVNKLKYVIPK